MFFISIANFFAKYSATRWCKWRPVRLICRGCYRFIMETPAELDRLTRESSDCTLFGVADRNTYPYKNHAFAPWPEDDAPGKYCIITDSQGGAIRRSVSYVLWKYHEATGKRLQVFPGGNHQNDAKNWHEVMKLNHKTAIKGDFREYLRESPLNLVECYIGVSPDEGEYGQLYWYEGIEDKTGHVYASTYFRFNYNFVDIIPIELEADYITWYKVS